MGLLLHNPGKENRMTAAQIASVIFAWKGENQSFKPVLIEDIQKQDIAENQKHHGKCFTLWFIDDCFQFCLNNPHIAEFLNRKR